MQQIYFGARIASYRKEKDLTQEALAQRLGVTNQAVSKWESDQCCPDIMLLPELADVFGITIDELFGRPGQTQAPVSAPTPAPVPSDVPVLVSDLPWPDDGDLRAVCYVGHKLMGHKKTRFGSWLRSAVAGKKKEYPLAELRFSGSVGDIHSDLNVTVEHSTVSGDIDAGGDIFCTGEIGGNADAGGNLSVSGHIYGDAAAGGSITCEGNIQGNADAGSSIKVGGSIGGDVDAGTSVTAGGNVGGSVDAGLNVSIGGDLGGDADVGGSVFRK